MVTRRRFLGVGLGVATAGLLAACAPAPAASPAAAGAPGASGGAPAAGAAATTAPAAARPATSTGQLRMVIENNFPNTLDATKDGFGLIRVGMAETLTRVTPDNKLVPWLAREVTAVDPSTWRVALRPNATFWDGSPVNAQAVQDAFKADWAAYPAANGLLSKETQITAIDATTLEFKTPEPMGSFPNAVSAQFFSIHKGGTVMTGPYKPASFAVGQILEAEAFAGHWAGPPPLAKLSVRLVSDANARVLGLRSGDVDFVYGVPPQSARSLGTEFTVSSIASSREDYIILNLRRPPFNDRVVREATALAVDRTALLTIGLSGQGAVATGLFPAGLGVDSVAMQTFDATRATQLLDEAGWKVGADGVRAKDGRRLAFQLYSAPARTEWTPMAVALQAQLKPLGYEIEIQQVKNIGDQLTQSQDFDAAMYSAGMLVTGDPLYIFNQTLMPSGPSNFGGYASPQLEAALRSARGEIDPAKRQALLRQAQEVVKTDVPNIYLVTVPYITATSKKVQGYVLNPQDLYIVDSQLSLAA